MNRYVAAIAKRIQDDLEAVVVAGVKVFLEGDGQGAFGFRVAAMDSDEKRIVVVKNANLGLLRRGSTLERLRLNKAPRRLCLLPGTLGKFAVDLNWY